MNGFIMQDWVTIRGISTTTSVTQSESAWIDALKFQDIAFWLEVRGITLPAGTLTLNYETAPIKDENLFLTTTPLGSQAMSVQTAPFVKSIVLSSNPTTPLSRWVRWRLIQASAGATWDVTFRICASSSAIG